MSFPNSIEKKKKFNITPISPLAYQTKCLSFTSGSSSFYIYHKSMSLTSFTLYCVSISLRKRANENEKRNGRKDTSITCIDIFSLQKFPFSQSSCENFPIFLFHTDLIDYFFYVKISVGKGIDQIRNTLRYAETCKIRRMMLLNGSIHAGFST